MDLVKSFEVGDVVRRNNAATGRDDLGIVVDVDLALITICFRLTDRHLIVRQLHELTLQDADVIAAHNVEQQRVIDELRTQVDEHMKRWSVKP